MCPGVGARSMVSWSAMNFGAGRASGLEVWASVGRVRRTVTVSSLEPGGPRPLWTGRPFFMCPVLDSGVNSGSCLLI